jgi:Spy/CpxP family protein refolding chaperone
MKKLLCAFGVALLLAACASETTTTADAERHAACRDTDPPVGSHFVRRSDCGAAQTPEQKEEARRQMEAMQRAHPVITK